MTITVELSKIFEWVGLFVCVGIPMLAFATFATIRAGGKR